MDFKRVKDWMTIVASVATVVFGTIIASYLQSLDSLTKRVDSMQPFFDRLVDPNPSKCRLAAFALYLLNRTEPALAVRMIVAADRQPAFDALRDIARGDAAVGVILSELYPDKVTDRRVQIILQEAQKPPTVLDGTWVYLGIKDGRGRYRDQTVDRISTGTVRVTTAAYVRDAVRGKILSVLDRDKQVDIVELRQLENGAVWGRRKSVVKPVPPAPSLL